MLLLGAEPPETSAAGPVPRAAESPPQAAAPGKARCGAPPALAGARAKSPSTPLRCCFPELDLNKTHVFSLARVQACFEVKHPGAVPLVTQDLPQRQQSEPDIKALVLTRFVNLALASVPANTNSKGAAGSCLRGSLLPAADLSWQRTRDGVSLRPRCPPAHAMWLLHTPVPVGSHLAGTEARSLLMRNAGEGHGPFNCSCLADGYKSGLAQIGRESS